jgi:hypothetical protein
MKSTPSRRTRAQAIPPRLRLIHLATRAPLADLPRIENIMGRGCPSDG